MASNMEGLSSDTTEIPPGNTDEASELEVTRLAHAAGLVMSLKNRIDRQNTWLTMILEYYQQGKQTEYLKVVELARKDADELMEYCPKDIVKTQNDIADSIFNNLLEVTRFYKEMLSMPTFRIGAYIQQRENDGFPVINKNPMRAENFYQLARCFHEQENYELAYKYYDESTKIASPKYVLPHYGLGKIYLYRNDPKNAARYFEKVLECEPDNIKVLRSLASIYACSSDPSKREMAKDFLNKVTTKDSHNVGAWMDLALILKQDDPRESLRIYNLVQTLLDDDNESRILPDIFNNMGSIELWFGNCRDTLILFEKALTRARIESEKDDADKKYFSKIVLRASYNLARTYETMEDYGVAKQLYKEILQEEPEHVDTFFRLGCLAAAKGKHDKADRWFKNALEIIKRSNNQEGTAGREAFDLILENPQEVNDTYSMIACGNLLVNTLLPQNRNVEESRQAQQRALCIFQKILRHDPNNIWAANGVWSISNHTPSPNKAQNVSQEATPDVINIWINIAHGYMEQKEYGKASEMYKDGMKKFGLQQNTELLQYIARAYYKNENMYKAKTTLLKALQIEPTNLLLKYNLGLVYNELAIQTFANESPNLKLLLCTTSELQQARDYFLFLFANADGQKFDVGQAAAGHQRSQLLLSQASNQISKAKRLEDEKMLLEKKQDGPQDLTMHRMEYLMKAEQPECIEVGCMLPERDDCVEDTKSLLVNVVPLDAKVLGGHQSDNDEDFSDKSFEQSGNETIEPHGEAKTPTGEKSKEELSVAFMERGQDELQEAKRKGDREDQHDNVLPLEIHMKDLPEATANGSDETKEDTRDYGESGDEAEVKKRATLSDSEDGGRESRKFGNRWVDDTEPSVKLSRSRSEPSLSHVSHGN